MIQAEIDQKEPEAEITTETLEFRFETGTQTDDKYEDDYGPIDLKQLLDFEFNNDYGGTEGFPFLAYSADRVYFPCCYDGAEWVESLPRNPSDEPIPGHFGGG